MRSAAALPTRLTLSCAAAGDAGAAVDHDGAGADTDADASGADANPALGMLGRAASRARG
jgi:hypothetical protein